MPGLKDPSLFTEEKEIERVLRQHLARIKVIGIGGAGNNTIHRLKQAGIHDTQLIAINTDAADLLKVKADYKILIGQKLTNGLGAGADPKVGEEAAKETKEAIKKVVKDSDVVFITCGLGGGTGTGAAPVVAQMVKKCGVLGIGVVTLPFSVEGHQRMKNAQRGLNKLKESVDTLVVIPNDKLMEVMPDVPIKTAFLVSDEVLINAVKGMAELITKPGLINVDLADVKAIMKQGGLGVIGIGESKSDKRQQDAVNKAVHNPLLAVDIRNAKNALVNVTGGDDLTLHQAHDVVEMVSEQLDPEAKVIWGAHINGKIKDTLRVMVVVTGIPADTFKYKKKTKKKAENVKQERKKPLEIEETTMEDLEKEYGLEVIVPSDI
jgi:cell division protein FtsZ